MSYFRALFLPFAASGLMAATAAVPLAELIAQSDVVVVATVADGVLSESGSTLMLACERDLSGKVPANGLLAVTFDGAAKSLLGQRGLWFARRTSSGSYRLHAISSKFDFFYPVPPGDLPHPFRYTATMPPGEKVMMEIA